MEASVVQPEGEVAMPPLPLPDALSPAEDAVAGLAADFPLQPLAAEAGGAPGPLQQVPLVDEEEALVERSVRLSAAAAAQRRLAKEVLRADKNTTTIRVMTAQLTACNFLLEVPEIDPRTGAPWVYQALRSCLRIGDIFWVTIALVRRAFLGLTARARACATILKVEIVSLNAQCTAPPSLLKPSML
jgi:hypothetical protein